MGRLRGRYDHVFAEVRDFPTRYGVPGLAQAVYRALPEGARFLTAGTFYWGWGLDPSYARRHAVPEGFTRLTANVLAFLAGD